MLEHYNNNIMNKKLIACELNEELFIQSDNLGIQSYRSPSGKEEYFVEAPGINFQTQYKDAEFLYEDLWEKPGDRSFAFAEIRLNGEYFGNSTFQKKYLGKELNIKLDNKLYKAEFKEKSIDLALKN